MYQQKETLCSSAHTRTIWLSLVVLTLTLCAIQPANAATGQLIANNTPRYVATSKNLGAEDPAKTMEVTIWLNLHDRAAFDSLVTELYDRTSPNYRHWLKNSDFARFAPTAEEAGIVKTFFESNHLKVVHIGPNNMFVRARGTVGDVQNAFHVTLSNYQVRGEVVRSNDRDPYVDGAAAPLVRTVSGLDSGEYTHPLMTQTPPSLSTVIKPAASSALATARPAAANTADFFVSNCFNGTEKETFSLAPEYGGPLPTGTYSGNHLNLESLTSYGCGYTPPVIQTAYNLTGLYNEGYLGTGQTIAIIDWCGSPTITADANAFSAQFGLPALTPSNFNIFNIPAPSLCASPNLEINLDVEWAHAIAPGANINLIVPPTNFFSDIDEAEYLTIYNGYGNVISGSYGAPEALVTTTELETGSLLSELAAAFGISANFATADDGDFSAAYGVVTVSYPADSPYSTAVGGVTLALNSDNSIDWEAGWGTNETILAELGEYIPDPVYFGDEGFTGGSGGGPSTCVTVDSSGNCLAGFPKPAFQHQLPGKQRQLPDVSWVADSFTGVAVLISEPFQIPAQIWTVVGGTSVATPMFSALWSIANEESVANGGPALGQAAPYVYSMPAGAIYDVVPVGSNHNVTASIVDAGGTTAYTAGEVLGGPGPATPGKFVSAIWDYPLYEDTAFAVSFGTDCSVISVTLYGGPVDGTPCTSPTALHTKVGWDNVTGVGTPNNAQTFADSFNPVNAAVK